MEIDIRKVKNDELSQIYDLVVALAVYEKEPLAVTATVDDYISAYKDGLIDIIVADYNGEVVGMALMYMTFSTWKGKMLYLEDFFVKPDFRSKGIGKKIFDAYVKEARERQCNMVKWEVIDWNVKAIKFYEENGATIEKHWYDGKIIF